MSNRLKELPPNHPHVQLLTGKAPLIASTFDQCFSFSLYVPKSHSFKENTPRLPLLVVVHGTRRNTGRYLEKLKGFCEQHSFILLCPLFPAGIVDPEDLFNYHAVLYKGIRYDTILLSMIDQAAKVWRLKTNKFYLHGFSGGGQFAHRFVYLHPERVAAVSIGAPGRFTPPDSSKDWPAGIRDIETQFGLQNRPDFEEMSKIPVQFIVGENDTDTALLDLVRNPNDAEAEAGKTRVDRIRWLKKSWEELGVVSELTVVPGVGHDGGKCLPYVEDWLKRQLSAGEDIQ